MAIFGPKPWVNPFGKMSIFRLFELLVFIVQKGVFLFQNIVKDIFLAYIAFKKKLEKWPFLDQNHGLTPFEKCQFFDFLDVFFYSLERCFFVVEYRKRHFPCLYCLKKICWKNGQFFFQNHGFTRLEKCQFFEFLNFLFLQPRKTFFLFQNMVKTLFWLILPKKNSWKNGNFWTKAKD